MQQQKLRDQGNKEACMDFNFSGLTQYSWSHSLQIWGNFATGSWKRYENSSLPKHPGSRVALCLVMYKHLAAKDTVLESLEKTAPFRIYLKYPMFYHVNQRTSISMHRGGRRHINRNHFIHLSDEYVTKLGKKSTKHCKDLGNLSDLSSDLN